MVGYRAGTSAVGRAPLEVSLPAARLLYRASFRFWPEKRRIVQANAAHVLRVPYHDPRAARLARRIYVTYARYMVELLRLPAQPPEVTERMVVPTGEGGDASFARVVERAREERRGIVVTTAHIGSMEHIVAGYGRRGWPLYGLADDSAFPELYELLQAQRRRLGIEVLAWRNMREVFRVLKQGAIMALPVDWGYRPDDVPVRLFGAWTTLPEGPALLAARTGALILPTVARRQPDGRFGGYHTEPIETPDGSPASTQRTMQQVADALERLIAPAPEQWGCFKPMWPDDPDEAARLEARAQEMRRRPDGGRRERRRGPDGVLEAARP